ncbi:Siderophore biosynthesis protein, monooxygenase [Minicystis rosea]|nr:Siderophore biosynthesis protein, monooxygenase [Minicystis rosea]
MTPQIHDLLGVGIGPFNLGLAALASSVPELRAVFLERRPGFDWHPGMMIEDTRLQVPYLADLVTAADPCHKLSFLAYLKEIGRLYQFVIRDNNFITRKEYNRYCQWAVERIPGLRFQTEVRAVTYDRALDAYCVTVWDAAARREETLFARAIVVGVGDVPRVPACVPADASPRIFHSSEYLSHKGFVLGQESVTVVGSGQSAAEIFYDLLQNNEASGQRITWLTRSSRYLAMEYSKLTLELSLPDYIDHFFGLPTDKRADVLSRQDTLYKGINAELINAIYDLLYARTVERDLVGVHLGTNCELRGAHLDEDVVRMSFHHLDLDQSFDHASSVLVLGTGYEHRFPAFLAPLQERMRWDEHGRMVVRRNYLVEGDVPRLFVQNAEAHTHGFTASDLSLGPYRNAVILNTILGREHFPIEKRLAFQAFGVPAADEAPPTLAPETVKRAITRADRIVFAADAQGAPES